MVQLIFYAKRCKNKFNFPGTLNWWWGPSDCCSHIASSTGLLGNQEWPFFSCLYYQLNQTHDLFNLKNYKRRRKKKLEEFDWVNSTEYVPSWVTCDSKSQNWSYSLDESSEPLSGKVVRGDRLMLILIWISSTS